MVNIKIKVITFFVAKDGEAVYSFSIFVAKDGEAVYRQQKQDMKLTVARIIKLLISKFRLKLKKAGQTTRPGRNELNQIPYEYAVEVTNRFTGLDLVSSVPGELWMEVRHIVQEAVNKAIPEKRKYKKAKWLSEEALQIAEERREVKSKRESERYPQTKCRVSENTTERQEGLLQ